jgi:hypothetical protein
MFRIVVGLPLLGELPNAFALLFVFGFAALESPYSASSSSLSPSNRGLNCTGSLYGASNGSGLNRPGFAGFATSRSIGP